MSFAAVQRLVGGRRSTARVAIANGLSRGVGLVVAFLSIRYATAFLGPAGYAVYAQFAALSGWLLLLDLGFGGSVQNRVSQCLDDKPAVQATIRAALQASGWVTLGGIAFWCLLAPLLHPWLIGSVADGPRALPLAPFMALGVLAVLPGTLAWIPRAVIGLHRGELYYTAQSITAVIGLGLLVVFSSRLPHGLAWTAILAVAAPVFLLHATMAMAAYRYSEGVRPEPGFVRELMKPAPGFALFALLAAAVNQIDVFVAAHVLPTQEAANYAAVQRLLQIVLAFMTAYIAALWPVLSSLMAEGQNGRVRVLLFRTTAVKCTICLVGCAVLPFALNPILQVVAPKLHPNLAPSVGLMAGLWLMCRCIADTYCLYFLASNRTRLLNFLVPIQAVLSAVGQVLLGQRFGAAGILGGLTLSFALTTVWFLPLKAIRSLARQEPA